jgi:hypothetical protein
MLAQEKQKRRSEARKAKKRVGYRTEMDDSG